MVPEPLSDASIKNRTLAENDTAAKPKEPNRTLRPPEFQADRQIELEAEP